MGSCIRACVSMPPVVHETIDGVVDDMYTERYFITKGTLALNNPQPPAQQPIDERADCTYTWDMLKDNHRGFLFMHDSMHQLKLQIREPHVNHSIPSREAFQ